MCSVPIRHNAKEISSMQSCSMPAYTEHQIKNNHRVTLLNADMLNTQPDNSNKKKSQMSICSRAMLLLRTIYRPTWWQKVAIRHIQIVQDKIMLLFRTGQCACGWPEMKQEDEVTIFTHLFSVWDHHYINSYVTGWEHETNQLHSSITSRIHLTLVCGIPLCFLNLITVVLMECKVLSIQEFGQSTQNWEIIHWTMMQIFNQSRVFKSVNREKLKRIYQRPESHFSTRQNRTLCLSQTH
jgi:hypothetical protein